MESEKNLNINILRNKLSNPLKCKNYLIKYGEKIMAVLMRHKSNIYGLVNDLTKLTNDIAAEVSRASGVEGSLSSLNTSTKSNLVAAINEVLAALQAQGSSVADDLANEISRAQAAEAQIASDLAAESARAIAAEGVLTTNLSAEVTRATNAEGVLTTNLATEVTRATTAEGVLTTNLSAEVTRATNAEGVLQSNIDTETAARIAGDNKLTTDLATEVTRATTAEGVLTTNLATEVTNRIAGDNALDSRLDIIEAGLMAGVFWKASFDTLAEMESSLTAVESSIEAGWAYYVKETNDGYVVVDENDGDYVPASWSVKSLIKFADYTEVSGLVATERARAIAAEGILTTDLASEIARATNEEISLDSKISAEKTRAEAAEGVLTTNLSTEVTRATNAESVLDGKISVEKTRAEAAEAQIASDLSAEVTRATNAESVLTSNLSAEVTRATGVESAIQAELDATQVGAGLGVDGSYSSDTTANYIATANSLKEADTKLDSAIKALDDDTYSKAETDNAIRLGGAIFITENVTVTADKIVLTFEPKNGLIFNFATVRHVDANFVSYDIPVTITATAGNKEFLLSADASGQFDGKSVIVQYAYIPVS